MADVNPFAPSWEPITQPNNPNPVGADFGFQPLSPTNPAQSAADFGFQPLSPTNPAQPAAQAADPGIFNPNSPAGKAANTAGAGGGDINSAFAAFVNANPAYAGGGQAAIDAFGSAYPQYAGIIAWDPNKQVYESQGGYFTNLPGNPQGGWSLTPTQPETGGGPANASLIQPWTVPFNFPAWQPPTALTEQNDPGYQARLTLGTDAVQASAAAQGVLHTGATLEGLDTFAQNYASNEFGNVYNRSLTDWQTNYNQALQGYQQAYNIFETNQGNAFNREAALAGVGQTAIGQLSSSGLGYTNTIGGIYGSGASAQAGLTTGGANAAAAGTVGAANAANGALGNLGSLGALYGYYGSTPANNTGYTQQQLYGPGFGLPNGGGSQPSGFASGVPTYGYSPSTLAYGYQ